MGKSWRRDAKNDRWRKAKQQKSGKKSNLPREIPEPDFEKETYGNPVMGGYRA
jgi:hypothetical protein